MKGRNIISRTPNTHPLCVGLIVGLTILAATPVTWATEEGEPSGEDLAKKLANPIASLISVPFQLNYDENIGPQEKGSVWRLNIQPVIPFSLTENWNVISRTILPVVWQDDDAPGVDDESGLGNTLQSLFFSPKEPTSGGLIWGAGPTAVALTQRGPWTIGMLANHIWSFAGDDDRTHVNATFLLPK